MRIKTQKKDGADYFQPSNATSDDECLVVDAGAVLEGLGITDSLQAEDAERYAVIPSAGDTIVAKLQHHAALKPTNTAYVFLRDGENDEHRITNADLYASVRTIAARLQQRKLKGKRVLLIYRQGIEFIEVFLGCLTAGVIPALVNPPSTSRMVKRIERIVADGDFAMILTDADGNGILEGYVAETSEADGVTVDKLPRLVTSDIRAAEEDCFIDEAISPGDIAFLQYTSGSTGNPKGVMVSHSNLMANMRAIEHTFSYNDKCIGVSWLPIFHDMGLVGSTLHPLYIGAPLIFMSPLHFIQRPVRWLRAISKYKATHSGGPNFAYDYCVQKIKEKDLEGLDLSSWLVAFNGSEPVRNQTVKDFYAAFKDHGLRPDAHMAVYGMAESTLLLTGTRNSDARNPEGCQGYATSGFVAPGHDLKIVDPLTCEVLEDGHIGEVWAAGPSISPGYYNAGDANAETFNFSLPGQRGAYLRTGDAGFMQDGQLHVTGRLKAMLIARGRNIHIEDIEWALGQMNELAPNSSTVFLLDEEDPDSVVVVAGLKKFSEQETWPTLCDAISARIYEEFQIKVSRVVLIRPRDLPKTTSGKIQRSVTRDRYLERELPSLGEYALPIETREGRLSCSARSTKEPKFATTPREIELAAIFGELLDLDPKRIDINENFFALGGQSIQMLELANRLDEDVAVLFRYPSIASYLYRSEEYQFPAVEEDIWLPAANAEERPPTKYSLLTGANGLMGVHLLASLLAATDHHFTCLIRGGDDEEVERKFSRAVSYFKLEEKIDRRRVTLLRGDFGQDRLGLSSVEYAKLEDNIQRIYHVGSHVNNWLPYEGIKEVNVEGTRRLLILARSGRKKSFHYASTSTFSPDKDDKAVFMESDVISPRDINKYNGYDISKYASEALCELSRKDGFDCNIYRLVWVGGQLATGRSKINDGLNIMLRILLTLGVYPKGNYLHDIMPVDLMADAVASVQGKAHSTSFNITSQSNESINLLKIVAMLEAMGYTLQEVSIEKFVDAMKSYPMDAWDEHCRSYRQLIIRMFENGVKAESYYDSSNFKSHLDVSVKSRLEARFVDEYFQRIVLFLIRQGALPTPSGGTYEEDVARIESWQEAPENGGAQLCLHQLFEAQAVRTPEADALIDGPRRLSYRALDERATQIAHYLQNGGAVRGDFIGICMDRTFDMYASILAVMKLGAAYVPLSPSYPKETLAHIVKDSSVRVVIADDRSIAQAGLFDTAPINLDNPKVSAALSSFGARPLDAKTANAAQPEDLAYVIYTSGTTGQPKGVMIEHRNVVNHALCMVEHFALKPGDNVLQFASMNFDSFIEEVFPALSRGAAVSLIGDRERLDIDVLRARVKECGVTILKFPTAFWHRIVNVEFQGLGVRLVGIGGEEADIGKFRQWIEVNPTIPVINTYGPTETAVTATVALLNADHAKRARLPIGRPLRNTRAHVLDDQLIPVPVGTIGNLYLSGAGVGRGYLNLPETTRATFLKPNDMPGVETLYKTGDQVRWTPEGELEFFGRADNQVKVRGYRIELSAIQSTLSEHSDIAGSAVAVEKHGDDKRIVAYVQTARSLSPEAVKTYIRQRLPAFMTPDVVILVDKIPMSPNGKVDMRALAELAVAPSDRSDAFAAPETVLQAQLTELWSNFLGLQNIGIDDDFLNAGGHSLLAISMLQRLYQISGVKVSIDDFYQFPTIRELAEHISSSEGKSTCGTGIVEFHGPSRGTETDKQGKRLFLIHGVGGNLATFYPLASAVHTALSEGGHERVRLYGLHTTSADSPVMASMQNMVERYVAEITAVQSNGPYLIGGWSFGVSVALMVAHALAERGEEIASFVSIDAQAPRVHADFTEFLAQSGISSPVDLYGDAYLHAALQRFGARFGFRDTTPEGLKDKLHTFLGYPAASSVEERDARNMVAVTNLFNAAGSEPTPIAVKNALLLKASDTWFEGYEEGWSTILTATNFSHREIEGDHWSIMSHKRTAQAIADFVRH
ncbi:amino acid adenylation domain-containing protein [Noviherbaspirillum sp. ST9]|uniref:amino acid adenylation domain-containing protein n=1 Tax=Noviherbaspirillum sp. ST9 TaxID=3401606 RepID=UPI003B58A752